MFQFLLFFCSVLKVTFANCYLPQRGIDPVHCAARHGHVDILGILLNHGACINNQSEVGADNSLPWNDFRRTCSQLIVPLTGLELSVERECVCVEVFFTDVKNMWFKNVKEGEEE